MALGALLQGSTKTIAPCHTRITISKPACSLFARPIISKVSVASNIVDTRLICARSHIETLLDHNALLKRSLVDSCQSSSFPEHWISSSFSEHWIEDCICEIVKHIHEAPFLQMLVNCEDNSTIAMTQRQRVPVGDALSADEKWREMKSYVSEASPDAVILVHDLCNSYIEGCNKEEGLAKQSTGVHGKERRSNGTHLWGVLVLGKTIAESACYILETTSVVSSFGTCTHFCLTKAQSFGPSWSDQIQSSWLLKTEV